MQCHLGSGRISPGDPKSGALTAQPRGCFIIFTVLIISYLSDCSLEDSLCDFLYTKLSRSIICTLTIEPSLEIMALFVLRKFILQTCMCRHPVGLDI